MNNRALLPLVLCLCPALAFADEAEDHAAKGTRFYNIQEWPSALKEYKEAYTLDPKPETLWAIAQVQRLSGDCRSAVLSYKAFMRTASAAGANAAQEFITKCQADLDAQQHAIDGSGPVTPARPPVIAPAPALTPPPPPRPAPARSWAFDPLGDVLFIGGVGGLVTGITFVAIGDLAMGDASRKPTSGEYDTAKASAEHDQRIGVVASIGGGVLTGLAIWRFIAVASRTNHHETADRVSVTPTRGGAFASYLVSF